MKSLRLSLVGMGLIALSGCAFSKGTPQGAQTKGVSEVTQKLNAMEDEVAAASITPADVKVSFIGLEKPNQYLIEVSVGKVVPGLSVQFGDALPVFEKGVDRIRVPDTFKGQKIEISVETYTRTEKKASSVYLGAVLMPLDYVFSPELVLGNHTLATRLESDGKELPFERVFLPENSFIILNGYNLRINAKTLIAKKQFRVSLWSQDGVMTPELLNGSVLEIEAEKVVGQISIYMRGKDGAKGKSASLKAFLNNVPAQAAAGQKGVDGRIRIFSSQYGTDESGRIQYIEQAMCEADPTNGSLGQDGAIFHGDDGGDGGDTGDLFIDVKDYSQSKFFITFEPGRAGKGGVGDFKGQLGGQGGAPGAWPGNPCPRAQAGANGRTSTIADSKPGKDGLPGKMGRLTAPQDPRHFIILQNQM